MVSTRSNSGEPFLTFALMTLRDFSCRICSEHESRSRITCRPSCGQQFVVDSFFKNIINQWTRSWQGQYCRLLSFLIERVNARWSHLRLFAFFDSHFIEGAVLWILYLSVFVDLLGASIVAPILPYYAQVFAICLLELFGHACVFSTLVFFCDPTVFCFDIGTGFPLLSCIYVFLLASHLIVLVQ